MKLGFFIPHGLKNKHFERTLEVLQTRIDEGHDCTVWRCQGALPSCEVNQEHRRLKCALCVSRGNHGFRLITGRYSIKTIRLSKELWTETRVFIPDALAHRFETIDCLRAFKIRDYDVGMGVASHLISREFDGNPDPQRYRNEILETLRASYALYRYFELALGRTTYDEVYVHNGRLPSQRALIRAAQRTKTTFVSVEASFQIHGYRIYKNSFPQDPEAAASRAREFWESSPLSEPERIILASEFYARRIGSHAPDGRSFLQLQKDGRLPRTWNPNVRNITYFHSSTFEIDAIDQSFQSRLFGSQLEAIKWIVAFFIDDANVALNVRLHPNAAKGRDPVVEYFRSNKCPGNCNVLFPESSVDTYELLNRSDLIIVYHSTVGIEAAYRGKPVVLVGRPRYAGLGSTYEPVDIEELAQLLRQENVHPLGQGGALIYAFARQDFIPHKYYRRFNFRDGVFRGKKLQASSPVRLFAKFGKLRRNKRLH